VKIGGERQHFVVTAVRTRILYNGDNHCFLLSTTTPCLHHNGISTVALITICKSSGNWLKSASGALNVFRFPKP